MREPLLEELDAVVDQPAVRLELRLAGTANTDAPAELLEVRPHARQARQRVLQLRELDLHLGLAAPRTRGEDVEDELRAIHDTRAHGVFHILALRWRQLVVDND